MKLNHLSYLWAWNLYLRRPHWLGLANSWFLHHYINMGSMTRYCSKEPRNEDHNLYIHSLRNKRILATDKWWFHNLQAFPSADCTYDPQKESLSWLFWHWTTSPRKNQNTSFSKGFCSKKASSIASKLYIQFSLIYLLMNSQHWFWKLFSNFTMFKWKKVEISSSLKKS